MFNESSGREANTFSDVLVSRAQTHADRRAYVFLRDGEDEEATLTFGQLHRRALAVAERLVTLSKPGERAVLLYPQGLEFIVAFFGCLYAGVVPVPTSVPNRKRGIGIVQGIAADSGASLLLSSTSLLERMDSDLARAPGLERLPRYDTELWQVGTSSALLPRTSKPSDTALLQYTSGSTGTPRGVVVTHANLLANHREHELCFGHDPDTVAVSWLPMFHDMGLGTVLGALWLGVPCILMAPTAFLQKPIRWLNAVSRYKATSSGGPDFAYDLCVRRITKEECSGLDLSSWHVAYNGSEPVRPATLARFAEVFGPYGFDADAFHPVYGLAEATLFVSGERDTQAPVVRGFSRDDLERGEGNVDTSADAQALVSCGATWLDGRLTIVNPETREPAEPGQIGEIWVSGPSVAAGYWRKPEETAATFQATTTTGQGPFLRTGDLGFLSDGRLFVTGRSKDLIIVRGRNHYPQDIEGTVANAHTALEPMACAAFSVESDDGEQLVIVQEVRRVAVHRLHAEDVFRAIRNVIADAHGLHTHAIVLLGPGNLPRTTSGKVRRKACKEAFMQNALSALASSVFGAETVEASVEHAGVGERATAMMPSATVSTTRDVAPDSARSRSLSAAQAANRLIEWLRGYGDASNEAHKRDELRAMSPALMRDFGQQGLLGMQIGQQHGGLGLGHAETTRVIEQLAAIDMNAGLFVGLNNYLGIGPIARHGTATVREALLPRLSQGAELAGFAFAEPANGSSSEALASYADPVNGSGWRLYGRKYASAGGSDGSVMNVFVRHRDRTGVTAFVVPRGTSGIVSLASNSTSQGTQSLTRSRVVLDGVYVKHEHVLGEVGQGMGIAMDAMAHAHLAVAAACLGGMKRCAQLVFHYATQRQTATGRLVAHPVTLAKLGRVTAGVTALECLVQQLALTLDSGPSVPPEAFTVCKVVAPEMLWQVVDDLVQLLGRRGYVETPHIRDLVRDAQALRSAEGPSEVMSALLGARLLNGGREGIRRFVSDVLKAPEVEPLLERAVNALRARGSAPSKAATVSYWEKARAGELATWIALLAAVEGRRRQASTGELERAATWTRANFERTLAALDSDQPTTGEDGDDAITASVSAYAHSVGQIDPLLMWGEQPVHPSVAPDSVPPSSERLAPLSSTTQESAPASAAAPAGPSSQRDLRAWVVSWLSARLRVAANQVDPRRSFADHGLDSLAAVEFAKALSDHLGRPLDETLLWNFATIDALVEYLEGAVSAPEARPSSGPVTGPARPSASGDETDLEAEIARLEDELRRR